MGTFNERAEKLMSQLSELAEKKAESNMYKLVNWLTLDVIAKVLSQSLLHQFLLLDSKSNFLI